MLLLELFEAGAKHVTFCFGRMNPPTVGHKQVLDTMKQQGGDMRIFVSQTQDKKKNPLDYATKIKFIKEMFPEYAGDVVDNAGINTIGKVASYLHEQGYNSATFVAGSDRLEDMKSLLTQYNGVEGKAHGYYKFEVLDFVSSGEREDGAEGVAGVSASGARAAAANNDFEAFQEATGAGELAKPLFAAVRKGMGINEDIEEGWKSKMAGAALAAGNLLATPAQAAEEPAKPITIAYVMIDGEVRKYNLGDKFSNAREAEQFITNILNKQGLQGYSLDIRHGYPKKKEETVDVNELATDDESYYKYIVAKVKTNRPLSTKEKEFLKTYQLYKKPIKEAPIELDPADPMDPMIYGHDKANPAKLKYRMLRAAGQLKDLAARADGASPNEWQIMARQFEELRMNMEQIRHALDELSRIKRKGGIRSRGITV